MGTSLRLTQESNTRAPSTAVFSAAADWNNPSISPDTFVKDYTDYIDLPTGTAVSAGSTGHAVAHGTEVTGNIVSSADPGSNANVVVTRQANVHPRLNREIIHEAIVTLISDDDARQQFVGLSEAAAVFASGDLHTTVKLGFHVRTDGRVDFVSGTDTILKQGVADLAASRNEPHKFGFRITRLDSTRSQLVLAVDGKFSHANVVTVLTSALPNSVLKPSVASTVDATTAPSSSIDGQYTFIRL